MDYIKKNAPKTVGELVWYFVKLVEVNEKIMMSSPTVYKKVFDIMKIIIQRRQYIPNEKKLMEEFDEFFYADDGIYIAYEIDNELNNYIFDFDKAKILIQKLKDFEEKYGELHKDERENLLKRKNELLELETSTNGVAGIYRALNNMYEFIEEY